MTDRLKGLTRIESVQKQMVRLAEVRLAAAERSRREITQDRTRLDIYVTEGALGAPLARAALTTLHMLDRRGVAAARAVEAQKAVLETAKRREHTVAELRERVARDVRRKEEDRGLAETLEGWLSDRASLP